MSVFKKSFYIILISIITFSACRVILYFRYFSVFSELSFLQTVSAFLQGIRFDLATILVFIAIPLLLITLPLKIFRSKLWIGLNGVIIYFTLVLSFVVLLGDVVYYDYVKRHLTTELIFLTGDFDYLFKEATRNILLFSLGMSVIFLGLFFWMRLILKKTTPSRFHVVKFILFFLLLVLGARGGLGDKPLSIVEAYSQGSTEQGNLILNGVFTASHTVFGRKEVQRLKFNDEKIEKSLELPEGFMKKKYPLEKTVTRDPKKPKYNIVVFMVESLTNRFVDSFGNNNYGVTPNLDEIAKNGTIFTKFHTFGQRSIEGVQSILTGLPTILGQPVIIEMASKYDSIASIAAENGYSTMFITGMLRKTFFMDVIAKSVGFENYYGQEDIPTLLDFHEERKLGWDYDALMFAMSKINEVKKPFLSFVYASTDHTPFPKLPKRFNKYDYEETGLGGFLNSMYYTDWAIGEFFKKAKKEAWFKNTIFAITGDHPGHFRRKGLREYFSVPLILYAPGIIEKKEFSKVYSQLDLMPTLIKYMNVDASFSSIGEPIQTKKDHFAVSRMGTTIAIMNEEGFVRHSLINRLETKSYKEESKEVDFQKLEDKLLAWDRMVFKLVDQNRWAR